jgi:hypothetical protein
VPPPPTDQPITIALKPLMHARQLTFRALADLTRDRDPEGRGVTYAYLCAPTSGRQRLHHARQSSPENFDLQEQRRQITTNPHPTDFRMRPSSDRHL